MQRSNFESTDKSEFAKLLFEEQVDKFFNIAVVLGDDPVIEVLFLLLGD